LGGLATAELAVGDPVGIHLLADGGVVAGVMDDDGVIDVGFSSAGGVGVPEVYLVLTGLERMLLHCNNKLLIKIKIKIIIYL
jgi:hypothetical protein